MGMFSRRTARGAAADETFSFLTVDEAARLRRLVVSAFAELRVEVAVHPDHVVDDRGVEFGLANLAALCHQDEAGRWPELVGEHVRQISRRMNEPSELDTILVDELRARVFPRLVGRDQADPALFSYAREITEDLVEVLCLDQPDTVAYLTDKVFPRLGPVGPVYDAALLNLRGVSYDEVEVVPVGDTAFHCVLGESVFTATTALALGDVAASVGEPIDPELGAFFVVACRNQVAFHPWQGGDAWPAVCEALLRWAELGFDDGVGPVSRELYWWRPCGIEQLSRRDETGAVTIDVRGDLAELVARLGGR